MAPVHEAALKNDVEGLRAMLDAGPGLIEAVDHQSLRRRPLHHACIEGHMEVAELLLDRGASMDTKDVLAMTPLMCACRAGFPEMVALLLSRGADPSLADHLGWTALMYALSEDQAPESSYAAVIRVLIKDGRVPANARGMAYSTALEFACKSGHVERARVLLLEGGAEHAIGGGFWQTTPKSAASKKGHRDCVHLLEWWEGELVKPFLLTRARAVVDATESISRAPEKVGAKTRAQAQQAREEAAPAWLRGRVERCEALPSVKVVGQARRRKGEEEGRAVCEFVVKDLKEDLLVELMAGLTFRRWLPEEE